MRLYMVGGLSNLNKNLKYCLRTDIVKKSFSVNASLALSPLQHARAVRANKDLPKADKIYPSNDLNFLFKSGNYLKNHENICRDDILRKYVGASGDNEKRQISQDSNDGVPELDKLLYVKQKLIDHLPKFFNETHPYHLYSKDVIFENLYSEPPKITIGALQYAIQLIIFRTKMHFKCSHIRFNILKITHEQKEGTIKIRWNIAGITNAISMLTPWKVKVWKLDKSIKNEAKNYDGFSILYLNKNGQIYKHTVQRVMLQKDEEFDVKKNLKLQNLNVGTTI